MVTPLTLQAALDPDCEQTATDNPPNPIRPVANDIASVCVSAKLFTNLGPRIYVWAIKPAWHIVTCAHTDANKKEVYKKRRSQRLQSGFY